MEKTRYNIFTEKFEEKRLPSHEELIKEFPDADGIKTDSNGNIEIGKILTEQEKIKLINLTKKGSIKV